jgi:uncharacterized coiled-coil DUF342 family protein
LVNAREKMKKNDNQSLVKQVRELLDRSRELREEHKQLRKKLDSLIREAEKIKGERPNRNLD